MIAGHFGLAAGVKKWAPRVPLWVILLGGFWLDIIFVGPAAAGLESIALLDPAHPTYGGIIVHADYTHSLMGAALIAAVTGRLSSLRWGKRGGITIGAVVFSHWILDLLVHRPDLPILPGNFGGLPLLGFGLWEFPAASAILELVLVLGGAYLDYRSALQPPSLAEDWPSQRRRALRASTVTAALLLLLHITNLIGL